MKVGIVTFHFAHNYGAMLQAFALQETMKRMGHEAFIIDYAPEYHTKWFNRTISWRSCLSRSIKKMVTTIVNKLRHSYEIRVRYDNFEEFVRQKLNLFPYTVGDELDGFDAVVLGSDQIWNEELTNNMFDGPYYGDGMKCKVISYAASTTYEFLTERQKCLFREKLSRLYAIGVREYHLRELLQPLTDKTIFINLDPTLICAPEVYSSLYSSIPTVRDYVLVYEITYHKAVRRMAETYAKQRGLKVISLVGHIQSFMGDGYDLTASPSAFVSYVKNANCVFTSSFHGTAVSIKLNKAFYAIKQNDKRDERIASLLSQLGLMEQFIEMNDVPDDCSIDYGHVQERLSYLVRQSTNYLSESLS